MFASHVVMSCMPSVGHFSSPAFRLGAMLLVVLYVLIQNFAAVLDKNTDMVTDTATPLLRNSNFFRQMDLSTDLSVVCCLLTSVILKWYQVEKCIWVYVFRHIATSAGATSIVLRGGRWQLSSSFLYIYIYISRQRAASLLNSTCRSSRNVGRLCTVWPCLAILQLSKKYCTPRTVRTANKVPSKKR